MWKSDVRKPDEKIVGFHKISFVSVQKWRKFNYAISIPRYKETKKNADTERTVSLHHLRILRKMLQIHRRHASTEIYYKWKNEINKNLSRFNLHP